MKIEISAKKKNLRKILSLNRENIKKKTKKIFNLKLFNKLINKLDFDQIKVVASFISIKSEISTTELNNHIMELKKIICFPKIQEGNDELLFLSLDSDESLSLGKFNIFEPKNLNNEVEPDLFFVPCLGFDTNGNRIGYGGGFYDKTFASLRQKNFNFNAVGYAFDDQIVKELPTDDFDFKLDYVLTEKQLYSFK